MEKIGSFKPKNPFFLAPMLEPNDIAFRLLCKKAGAGLTFTGMTNPLSRQKLYLQDKPAIQLFGTTTKGIKQFIEKYEKNISLWDFNLACPSKLSKKLGHGAFLQKHPQKIKKILSHISSITTKPLTIKLRKTKNTEKVIKISSSFIDAFAIHPRTIEQGYSGTPDIKFALFLKKQFDLPVIYSGNVNLSNAKSLLEKFDFLHIGREAIGNPNIFSKLTNSQSKYTFNNYLTLAKKYKIYFRQVKYQALAFTKSLKHAKKMRAEIINAKTIDEIKKIYKKYKKSR